ncbi:MAG: tetratricopeptide repeat protein, partial [Candidatus Eisenbacteria bacterium]|nr:tetratricopeptide repeat protein [Candidatus Eisenbacteria bacterium]
YKKGEQGHAAERYLDAVTAYEKASLFKNAIAVCKKMLRLTLSQGPVLKHLAELHSLDGLASEASIYFAQYGETMVRANNPGEAAIAFRRAFDNGQENPKLLEQLAEVQVIEGEDVKAAETLREAAQHWRTRGAPADALRCDDRARQLNPAGAPAEDDAPMGVPETMVMRAPSVDATPSGSVEKPFELESSLATVNPETMSGLVTPPSSDDGSPVRAAASMELERPARFVPPSLSSSTDASVGTPDADANSSVGAPLRQSQSSEFERAPRFAPPVAEVESIATPPVPEPGEVAPVAETVEETPVVAEMPVVAETPMVEETPVAAITPPVMLVSEDEPSDEEEATEAAGVYEIEVEEESSYESALHEVEAKLPDNVTPFPVAAAPPANPTPSLIARRPEGLLEGVSHVEHLLKRAQDEFRAGRRDLASQALVEAALTYEKLGRLDSAATIFRSLGRGAQAPAEVVELWLKNCEQRGDRTEGSQVACELGDRALNDGDETAARTWFTRALEIDPAHETARRRMQRLDGQAPDNIVQMPAPPVANNMPETGRVEVALGRAQAVTFDLSGLLSEFQRGVESQLEGDAQGHYDLGMAYREMGLHEQAIESFRTASKEPRLRGRAHEMIGRCLADSGVHDEAVREFETALSIGSIDGAGEAELRYQWAMSLAATGEYALAVTQLERADRCFPGRPDIADRLFEYRSQRKAA